MEDGGRPHQARAATGGAAALAALLVAAPPPQVALAVLGDLSASGAPTDPVLAVVALLAWGLTGWLALTVLLVVLSRLPGLLGRTARAAAARLAPATVRRAVEAALGLTVAVGTLAPSAALAVPVAGPPRVTTNGPVAETTWDLDWPARTAAQARAEPATTRPTDTARRTATPTARPTATPGGSPAAVGPRATPLTTASAAALQATPRPARPPAVAPAVAPAVRVPPTVEQLPSAPAPAPVAVVVRRGDTLWSLAEAALRTAGTTDPTDRQVAQAWPRWWAANREVVGDDPDLLLPGTVLRPPPADSPNHR